MSRRHRKRQRGVALLLVLWVFMILGVLALDFSRYMRDDAMASVNFSDSTRGYYVALAGLNLALFERKIHLDPAAGGEPPDPDAPPDRFPTDGEWHDGTFAGSSYQVRLVDQGALLPLNVMSVDQLKPIVKTLMLGPQANVQGTSGRAEKEVDEIVAAIVDWRDLDKDKSINGAEREYYLSNDRPLPKDAPFDDLSELLSVRGVTAGLYYGENGMPGLRDVFTVFPTYSDGEEVHLNIRYVTSPVIQVLLRKTPEEAEELIAARSENLEEFLARFQGELNAIAPGAFPEGFLTDSESRIVFVEARADSSNPRNQANVGAIVDLISDEAEYYKIERWYDRMPWRGTLPTGEFGESAS